MGVITNEAVEVKFENYPASVRPALDELRAIILDVAKDIGAGAVEESLKWGEPNYRVKSGSPIRIDWKLKSPDNYYLFFNCNTKLVDTFRQIYSGLLQFEGNRAIVLKLNHPLPIHAIKHCIELALTYHKVKHLPLLGA
ncbi:hypothetical protein PSECIP111951_00091 [Pseudoalteromonas holothuriae]|uniref:YdhG-like domain-containing protein n=1 Tax=Pseudoalteromonas holothuriae TaxID=2963714 RepID=A0A9W4VN31_9GAMM|nr:MULTISPECIES: DUF1801 domain-containing protein [unclassified Pseudoalteromonas]CAH9049975.1 hypothetical protein PSECIP111951_00091 [Pseudoalteromonas sp. CIP111951]CAH9052720.1 hypothetical protein PSECIP111854_01028 [Pseudoalteromonas sp. CIP111854]